MLDSVSFQAHQPGTVSGRSWPKAAVHARDFARACEPRMLLRLLSRCMAAPAEDLPLSQGESSARYSTSVMKMLFGSGL